MYYNNVWSDDLTKGDCPHCWADSREKKEEIEVNEQDAVNQIIEARFAAMKPEKVLGWKEQQVLLNALFWHKNDRADGPDQRIAATLFDWITSIQNSRGDIVITTER